MRDAPHRLRWFSTLITTRRADRILEVGCGNGQLLELLASRRSHAMLVGIDRSALQARKAAQHLALLPIRPQVHHGTFVEAPTKFAEEPFSRIVAMNVNLFWTDPATAGEALRALLAPRGRVLLGFEPPQPGGRTALQAKLARAVTAAGFVLHAAHEDDSSSAFAVEWSPQPRRAHAGATFTNT